MSSCFFLTEADQFICAAGKPLPIKATEYNADGKPMKAYWGSRKDCTNCVLKATCCPNTGSRRIIRTAYDPEYQRAYIRKQSRRGKRMKRLRQSTVEPVFGSLIKYYGLNKINVLGKDGAHKNMVMAAIAFNVKKFLKTFKRKLVNNKVMEAPVHLSGTFPKSLTAFGSAF